MKKPEFAPLAAYLLDAKHEIHASELHGMLCAFVAVKPNAKPDHWIKFVVSESELLVDDTFSKVLTELFEAVSSHLHLPSETLEPLLPNDDIEIEVRFESLQSWCEGFMYTLGATGAADALLKKPDLQEMLTDIATVQSVGLSEEVDESVNEEAFTEVLEYLKLATPLVFYTERQTDDSARQETLH